MVGAVVKIIVIISQEDNVLGTQLKELINVFYTCKGFSILIIRHIYMTNLS
jgi:hypothetical protein